MLKFNGSDMSYGFLTIEHEIQEDKYGYGHVVLYTVHGLDEDKHFHCVTNLTLEEAVSKAKEIYEQFNKGH